MCQPHAISPGKQRILSLVPIIPALLSVIGSMSIIRLVWGKERKGPYERLLIGLSLSDIVMTVSIVASNFLSPVGTMVWSTGNSASCVGVGVLFQLGTFSAALYNSSLAVYYLITIRGGPQGEVWMKKVEPCMHGLCLVFPLSTAMTGIFLGAYGFSPITGLCWVACASRCNDALLMYLFAAPVPIGWVVIAVSMFLIWRFVYTTVQRHNSNSTARRVRREANPGAQRSSSSTTVRDVAIQALLYVSSFTFVTFWPILVSIMAAHNTMRDQLDPNELYPLMVLCSVFFPSAGFFNVLIFLRPRYLAYLRNCTTTTPSRVAFFWECVVQNESPVPRIQTTVACLKSRELTAIPEA